MTQRLSQLIDCVRADQRLRDFHAASAAMQRQLGPGGFDYFGLTFRDDEVEYIKIYTSLMAAFDADDVSEALLPASADRERLRWALQFWEPQPVPTLENTGVSFSVKVPWGGDAPPKWQWHLRFQRESRGAIGLAVEVQGQATVQKQYYYLFDPENVHAECRRFGLEPVDGLTVAESTMTDTADKVILWGDAGAMLDLCVTNGLDTARAWIEQAAEADYYPTAVGVYDGLSRTTLYLGYRAGKGGEPSASAGRREMRTLDALFGRALTSSAVPPGAQPRQGGAPSAVRADAASTDASLTLPAPVVAVLRERGLADATRVDVREERGDSGDALVVFVFLTDGVGEWRLQARQGAEGRFLVASRDTALSYGGSELSREMESLLRTLAAALETWEEASADASWWDAHAGASLGYNGPVGDAQLSA